MMKKFDRKLILEDGSEYYGYGFGAADDRVTEIVFNTSPVGYQEIISDPSYTYQTVVMAYPLIGNYGIAEEDFETETPTIGGLVVRDYNDLPSNFRSKYTLSEIMEQYGIPGIYGIDTRKLVRSIRDLGSRKALITDADTSLPDGLSKLAAYEIPKNAVELVSRKKIQQYQIPGGSYQVAAIDCGICLGHQIISLAYGAKTYKLKFGHRGGNHPVKNLITGKIEITSQNHSYAVDRESLADTRLQVTHLNLLDQTIEGVACKEDRVFSVQYHPESAPGPQDSGYLFDQFIEMMEEAKNGKAN